MDSNFVVPTFGVTFLGTSHGFDAKGSTTGFVIWINGGGILVDPPQNSSQYLREKGIPLSFVNKVILTHCHSDHDSGVLKQIVGGEKITLITTKTIERSYRKKIQAVTGDPGIVDFYHFLPVPIGSARIMGANFEFDYSFHTIPTLRFKVSYGGRTISYSADTYYNPQFYAQLREKKILTAEREVSLNMFLWDADLIIHEAGVPPIHTPISILNDLPASLKKKLVIVHCASIPSTVEKQIDENTKIQVPVTDLRIPPCGRHIS